MLNKRWLLIMFVCLLIVGYGFSHAAVSSKNVATKTSTASNATSSNQNVNGYLPVSFDFLGDYDFTDPVYTNGMELGNQKSQIPDKVKSLNGKKVAVRGFFYPMTVVGDGSVSDFLLLRNQIYCCFGCAVRTNEWVYVTPKTGKPIKANLTSRPVTLYGTLEVGEKFDNGCLLNLYRLKLDKIVEDK
jgi:hypothetical protein